ncbi:MAG: YtxH domain-containing protein [Anaerolineae bacterium]|nr:YtxH domain-containing protein [Phycisphaerae bacterium]
MAQRPQRNSRGQFLPQSQQSRGSYRSQQARTATNRSQRSCGSATGAVLSLLAGAGVGVAMMYLFDPEEGEQRRRRLANRSAQLLESSKDLAYETAQTGSSAAQSIGSRIAGAASHVAGLATDYGSRAASHLSTGGVDLVERARESLPSLTGLRESASDAKHRVNLALGREKEHHYVGQTACAVGSLALGAGLLWMFDPRLGRSRRTWLRDKGMHWMRESGDFFRYAGTHAANRIRGTVAETRGYFRGNEPVDDAKLSARIRSELGRVVEDAHAVEVVAQDGYITLRGTADGAEITSVASLILGIRGVRGFDNQLRAHGNPTSATQSSPV